MRASISAKRKSCHDRRPALKSKTPLTRDPGHRRFGRKKNVRVVACIPPVFKLGGPKLGADHQPASRFQSRKRRLDLRARVSHVFKHLMHQHDIERSVGKSRVKKRIVQTHVITRSAQKSRERGLWARAIIQNRRRRRNVGVHQLHGRHQKVAKSALAQVIAVGLVTRAFVLGGELILGRNKIEIASGTLQKASLFPSPVRPETERSQPQTKGARRCEENWIGRRTYQIDALCFSC